ncbi:MAG: gliding motility-associated C-terminal domain-containing protein [Spirosomataceae bacterium]
MRKYELRTCKSSITLQVTPPLAPLLKVDKQTICNGERVTLTAEGCNGILQWSNGMQGRTLQIQPSVSAQYTAVCLRGDCSSTPSLPISITVHENVLSSPQITKELKNTCPFITVDLSAVLSQKPPKGIYYEAHLGSSYLSPLVTDISAVSENRSYYIFARNKYNCYSLPTEVKVSISPCDKPLPICTNNPATALFEKSERTAVGNYYLQGKVGGAASSGHWSTNGTGTFNTNNGLSTIYSPSAEDRQAGKVMIQFSSDDPDGQGPCKAGAVWYELKVDTHTDKPKEVIGINKFVKGWKKLKNHLFEIEYVIQVVNMGANDLVEISIIDSLDRVFKNGAVIVDKPIITAIDPATNSEIKWGIDESYSGKNGFYNLLLPEKCSLLAGQARVIMIRSKIDFANAKDSMYYNSAWVSALDINGNRCLDKSVNGNWPDINQNEDPTDDTESTPLALNSLLGNEEDIFIPEGFSPNSDGVNDFFMVRKPTHLKASLEIYNRWGGLIYQTEDYKNDWNGGANTQANAPSGTYFYVLKLSDGREFSRFLTISR